MFAAHEIVLQAYNRPLCVLPEKLAAICAVLEDRTGIGLDERFRQATASKIERLPTRAQRTVRGPSKERTEPALYSRVDRVGIIQIHGTLINRGSWIGAYSGLTSFEGIRAQLRAAKEDAGTTAIILDIDSGGGQAAGAFETASLVRELASVKRTVAVVDAMAASAAYAIASGANEIVTTPTGVLGSVGVVLMHLDQSGKLEKSGLKPSFIFAGARKIDANSFQPLPDEVRENLQAEVDQIFEMFIECVTSGRNRMSAKQLRDTEAGIFIGANAVAVGLADRVGDLETTIAQLRTANSTSPSASGLELSSPKYSQIDFDRISAEAFARGRAQGLEESVTDDGIAAAQARMAAILALPEARGRSKAAQHLAVTGAISIDVAKAILAASGTEADEIRNNGMGLYLVDDIDGKRYK